MESNKAFRVLSYVAFLSLLLIGESVATYQTCSQIMSCKSTQVRCYLGCVQHFGYYSLGICTPSTGSQVPPAGPQDPPPPAGPQDPPPPAGPQDPPPPAGPEVPAPAAGPQVPPPEAILQSFENEQNWGGRDEPCQCKCVFPKGYQQECPPSNPPPF